MNRIGRFLGMLLAKPLLGDAAPPIALAAAARAWMLPLPARSAARP